MNESMKRIYVHIGVMKTATSSLQQSLFKNRKALVNVEGGYLYPQVSYFHHGRFILSKFTDQTVNPREFVRKYKGDRRNLDEYAGRETIKFEKEINHSTCENMIISGEQIPRLNVEQLEKFKAYLLELAPNAEIIIVACTREHTSWFASYIQQSIKVARPVDFANAIADTAAYYQNNLAKFFNVFNKENMIVYKFEDIKKYKEGPIGMFFSHINVDTEGVDLIDFRSNEGYSGVAVDILMYINKRLPLLVDEQLSKGRRFFDDRMLGRLSGEKYLLTREIIADVHMKSLGDKIWLRDYFGIDYVDLYSKKHAEDVLFESSYVNEFKCIFVKLKPVIQKLCYDYINEKSSSKGVNEETESRLHGLIHWADRISADFGEKDLNFFIANNQKRYKVNAFSYGKSLMFFSSQYDKRFGLKKLLAVLIHRDGEELFR